MKPRPRTTIEKYLKEKYGSVAPHWNYTIDTIIDNLNLIEQCKQTIEEVGIYDRRTGRKNPLLATIKDLQASNLKAFQQLGLTPWSESKIKSDNGNADEELMRLITMSEENE